MESGRGIPPRAWGGKWAAWFQGFEPWDFRAFCRRGPRFCPEGFQGFLPSDSRVFCRGISGLSAVGFQWIVPRVRWNPTARTPGIPRQGRAAHSPNAPESLDRALTLLFCVANSNSTLKKQLCREILILIRRKLFVLRKNFAQRDTDLTHGVPASSDDTEV